MGLRQRLAALLDPLSAAREKELRYRIFVLRDTLKQVAWRQAMDLRSVDQKAAYRLIHMALDADRQPNPQQR